MKKAHLAALEKLFTFEVSRALNPRAIGLPMQSTAKVFTELEREGMVEPAAMTVPSRFGPITVRGWELTHAGRAAYCATCTNEPEKAA
jgi:hypothetical protein